MRTALANLSLLAATLAGVLGLSESMLTLATNEAAQYRPVLLWAVGYGASCVMLSALFAFTCEPKRRVWALGPIAIALFVLFEAGCRWPYVFA